MTDKKKKWERDIQSHTVSITTNDKLNINVTNILSAVSQYLATGTYLAHAIDGVQWGTVSNISSLSNKIDILTDLRVFNESQYLYIWHSNDTLDAILIEDDNNGESKDAFDECHILWGTSTVSDGDSTELVEGAQGFRFTVPDDFYLPSEEDRTDDRGNVTPLTDRVVINIRHYLGEHDNGMNYVAFSRILGLKKVEFWEEKNRNG